MSKLTIAVDVDDTIARSAESWVSYSNKTWGTQLTVDDYLENWTIMWGISDDEVRERAYHLHTNGVVSTFSPYEEAKSVLQQLSKKYRLIVVTSRNSLTKDHTLEWLNEHFGGVFDEIHMTGFYDNGNLAGVHQTKDQLLGELGANYLIDDQPKHCFAAAAAGIPAVLFGNYAWTRAVDILPEGVTKAANWTEVLEYFNGLDRS